MALTAPVWLAGHDCSLQRGVEADTFLVLIGRKPQYMLKLLPLGGKHGCNVTQTINGRRLDAGGTFSTVDEAILGGLEDLRKALGW